MNEDQDEINNLLAEREWEEFKKSSFGKFFTAKQMKEQELTYLNNKALDIVNEEDLFEIMSLIPQPFITNENIKKADILSVIYNNFIEETEIPLTLPIFSFFSFLSAFCVKNNITYSMPLSEKKSPVNTWVTVLAPSGSAKTYSLGKIEDLIPIKPDGEKVVEQNFVKPSGPAKFIEEFSNLPDSRDGKSQYGFWIEDEVAQMFKQVEREGTPLSEIKEYFLKAYDNKKLTRKSKKETIETKNLILVLFFINTFDSYVNNISSESMTDGLMRRFNLVYTEKDKSRDFTDFPIYNEKKITDEILSDRFEDLFFNINPDVNYTFSETLLNFTENISRFFGIENIKISLPIKKIFTEHI